MKILILMITFTTSTFSYIKPGLSKPKTNDPYVQFQWNLDSNGQIVISDIDDITPIETISDPQAQIDWSPDLDSLMTRDISIAVIDSGLDIDHEDLKNRILINESECKDGKIPLGQVQDNDKNGFEGDCAGWNFATNDKKQLRFVNDDIGHGTHVAGIIAANINNEIGISGLSNRIKILPLKVYDKRETSAFQRETISERVARAIDYAALRNVDVINLSLGWPIIGNSHRISKSIQDAYKKGIFIVAAAGNDRHEAQVYPCAFNEVFCVGSINNDLRVSRFSNFGGHVDILAPGGQILSLIPSTISSDFFGIKGYDIKFGTSQAAPIVSGIAGIIKGIYPHLSNDQIKSALIKNSLHFDQNKSYTKSGLIQAKKTIIDLKNNFEIELEPNFKGLSFVEIDPKSFEASMIIPFNKMIDPESKIRILISESKVKAHYQIIANEIKVNLKLENDWQNAKLAFDVIINKRKFHHQIQLAKKITHQNSKTFKIDSEINFRNYATIPTIQNPQSLPEYFSFDKESKKLTVLAFNQNKISKKHIFDLNKIDDILPSNGIVRTKINEDLKLDYWITGLKKDAQGNPIELKYYFFDDQGNQLNSFDTTEALDVVSDYSLPSPNSTRFIKINDKDWGTFYTAVSMAKGSVEKIDQSQDVFNINPDLFGTHLTYLWPEKIDQKISWRMRTFTNDKFQKKIKSLLSIPSWMEFEFLTIIDSDNQSLKTIFRLGTNRNEQNYIYSIKARDIIDHANFQVSDKNFDNKLAFFDSSFSFINQAFDYGYLINDENQSQNFSILKGQFSKDRYRILDISSSSINSLVYKTTDPREFISSLIKFFKFNDRDVSIFELDTEIEIVSKNKDNIQNIFSTSLYRSSFIQGTKFSLRFQPMTALSSNHIIIPTIYVDNSKLYHSTFQMWAIENDKLFVPIKFSFSLPSECVTLNPIWEKNHTSAVIYCSPSDKNSFPSLKIVSF